MAGSPPRVVWMPGGVRTEIHLGADDTAGAFCLLVDHPPAGWALPPHRHLREAETIHVLEGSFAMVVGGVASRVGPGETVHVPAGVVHSGGTVGDLPGRRVVVFSPGGMERFFLEAGAASPNARVDVRAALESATRHGWEFVAETAPK
jgi:mannose-6-phosphate isomerase-like protein (cupin superfamily)